MMLRVVLNIDPCEHVTNEHLYSGLPKLSERVAARRLKLAGHCHRVHPENTQQAEYTVTENTQQAD